MRQRAKSIFLGVLKKEPNYVYYFLSFLRGLGYGLIGPVYVLLLFSAGLNPLQVTLINLVFLTGNFLFQVPAGAFADALGRKKAYLISLLFQTTCFFVYASFGSWQYFVIAEIFSALGFAFMGGALDAWVVDRMKEKGFLGRTDFLFSRFGLTLNVAQIFGGLATTWLIGFGLQLPFLVGGLVFLFSFVISWFLIEEERVKGRLDFQKALGRIFTIGREGMVYSFKRKEVGFAILYSAILWMGFRALDIYWPKRFEVLSGSERAIAHLWVFMAASLALGSHLSKKWADRGLGQIKGLIIATFGISLLVFSSTIMKNFYPAAILFVVYELFRGAYWPFCYSFINQHTGSVIRATVLSFNAMVMSFGGMIALLTSGLIAKKFSIETAWLVSCGFFWLALLPLFRLYQKKKC